uniref:CARD domain-containing protein n=1 Tax=Hippocampus comes TaxID=109280 RepID=A0A3Q2XDB2_HIPCM
MREPFKFHCFLVPDVELLRVRSRFVERVSEEVINQLLDDLSDTTLNDGEREAIIEGNVTRADRARALIDTIRKKGSKASAMMIVHLQRRDLAGRAFQP